MSNMNTAIRTTTKTTKGRQKIEIKKIESISNRQVTFTKRRGGLFKKAGELCILTAAEVAVIVKSPGGRTFAFGHPSVGSVVDRYLGGGATDESPESAVTEDCKGFVGRYDEVAQELAAEKKRREMIMESNVANPRFWWEKSVDELGLEELEPYVAALEELKKRVTMRADELMLMKAASSNSMHSSTMFAMNPISTANSSGLASHHFINQANIYHSSCSTKMDPHGYDFGRGHAPLGFGD